MIVSGHNAASQPATVKAKTQKHPTSIEWSWVEPLKNFKSRPAPTIIACKLMLNVQVNYLGHWLLTHQLLMGQRDLRAKQKRTRHNRQGMVLPSSAAKLLNPHKHRCNHQERPGAEVPQHAMNDGTRVVLLSSMTHRAGRIQFDDLHATRSYNSFRRYADSKLELLLAVRAFAQRMQRQVD